MLNKFIQGYIVCMLWASVDEDGDPIDNNFGLDDISPEAMKTIEEDCTNFYNANLENLTKFCKELGKREEEAWESAGHDFWLTRNGHGTGYFDRDVSDNISKDLTESSHVEGSCDIYVGDDGKIYIL